MSLKKRFLAGVKSDRPREVADLGDSSVRAKQSFKDQVNINMIVARYHKTGVLPDSEAVARFEDVSEFPDFRHALDVVIAGRQAFDAQPVSIRKRFQFNPAEMLEFLADPANRDEAEKLGLVKKPGFDGLSAPAGDLTDLGGNVPLPK